MALEKWEAPKTITALRGFLGFTNYYSNYVENYAKLVAPLQDLLKVDKATGKKGSRVPVRFGEEHLKAFADIKEALLSNLCLYTARPDQPFILRVDASGKAVGGALEQFLEDTQKRPTLETATTKRTFPVAFCSRKLTPSQVNGWSPREK